MNYVITIGREFGSGGGEIGKKLSEALGIEYYDKKILEMASERSGINQKMFENADEKHNSFLYSLSMAHYGGLVSPVYLNDIITNDKLFIIQSNIIKEVANKSSCVIVGRCANEILKDHPHILNIYIHADIKERTHRIMELYHLPEKSALTLIKKTDKNRSAYYNFYTNEAWGAAKTYDLCINSLALGIDGTVDLIENFVQKKFK